eukprot:1145979-Pelagomonas_calceolata.AAC.2
MVFRGAGGAAGVAAVDLPFVWQLVDLPFLDFPACWKRTIHYLACIWYFMVQVWQLVEGNARQHKLTSSCCTDRLRLFLVQVQQLMEENARLQHELTDVKRRVLQAAKRKIAEHAGAIKDKIKPGRGSKFGSLAVCESGIWLPLGVWLPGDAGYVSAIGLTSAWPYGKVGECFRVLGKQKNCSSKADMLTCVRHHA